MNCRRASRNWTALLLFAASAACQERTVALECYVDQECGASGACVQGTCLARGSGAVGWQVELIPPPESAAIRTELPAQIFSSGETSLTLGSKVTTSGLIETSDLVREPLDVTQGALRVQFGLPSKLAGRENLLFEAAATGGLKGAPAVFSLSLPGDALGTIASAHLLPPPPLDQILPPWSRPVLVEQKMVLALPGRALLVTVEGKLHDALKKPVAGFMVRAMVAGQLVSNRALTGADGAFALAVVRELAGTPLTLVDLTFVPPMPSTLGAEALAVPSLFLSGVALPGQPADPGRPTPPDLMDLRLPAAPAAEALRIQVLGLDRDNNRLPVAGASLSFRTNVGDVPFGKAIFARDAQTKADGVADVFLIPGEAESARDYLVAVVAPADSPFASACLPHYAVVAVGQASGPRTAAPVELPRKLAARGVINHADGTPAARIAITATRLVGGSPDPCENLVRYPTATTVTDEAGQFDFPLERGRYRMEYRPPAGSPSPIFVEWLDMEQTLDRRVTLPRGVAVDGIVMDAEQRPLEACEVRVSGSPQEGAPEIAGQAVSGADGRFRLILPAQ